jgi:hypothetical protein
MRMFQARISILMFPLLFSMTGCVMSNMPAKAPSSSGTLPVPAGVGAETVLSCAESSVQSLRDKNELWNTRVTRRDVANGVLETGNFEEENVGGFRVSAQYKPESNSVQIRLKGAGPYFMDIGVDQAFADLDAQMRQCLSSK